jgi:hypothetical protein
VPTTPSETDNDSRNIEEELGGILRKLEEDNRKEYEEIMSRIQRQSSPESTPEDGSQTRGHRGKT